ncbi:MAG: class I SAM-dependent methyltransferase [Nitrospinota bacterium]
MTPDAFERYPHNLHLSPVSTATLEALALRCGLGRGSSVLDAACGKGGACLVLARRFGCQVTGVEEVPEFAEEARRLAVFSDLAHLVDFLEGPPDALPFDEGFFDLALRLGPAHPFGALEAARDLGRFVRPGGWMILGALVWREGGREKAGPALRAWLEGFAPARLREAEELRRAFGAEGLRVEEIRTEPDASWEAFLAPQARVVLENRREQPLSPEAKGVLDRWQEELELFHTGGGRETLAYVTFLLRLPDQGETPAGGIR